MEYFNYTFNDDEWTIYLIEDGDDVIADEDAVAQTKFDEKEIYFRRSHYTMIHVIHELCHVYFGYCYLENTTEITIADFEEIACTLFSHNADKIRTSSQIIYQKLNDLKDK